MSHEYTVTHILKKDKKGELIDAKEGEEGVRYYNMPSHHRRTYGHVKDPVKHAERSKFLGKGFDTMKAALLEAGRRSERGSILKDPRVTGGRVRRREKLQGIIDPFNPGGKAPGRRH